MVIGNEAEIHKEILSFAKVAWIRGILRNSTLGLLANYNEAMWSTYMDPYNLFTRIGPELRFITYSALDDEIKRVPDAEIKAYKAEFEEKYPVMEDVDNEKFYAAVRGSLGLAGLTERLGITSWFLTILMWLCRTDWTCRSFTPKFMSDKSWC